MRFHDVQLSSWAPKLNHFLYRESPREPASRVADYEDRFDFRTIFYDVFWSEDRAAIKILAPPLLSLRERILAGHFTAWPGGEPCAPELRDLGPIHLFVIPVPAGTLALTLAFDLSEVTLAPQPNLVEAFAGKRAILTVSRNNPLHWIRDWLYFHVTAHGSNALLFYDNASDLYSKYDLREAIATVPGLDEVAIIEADFPYGPPPSLFRANDSRFLQRSMLEHAHHRFAARCASVFNGDVDELIVSPDGLSVHAACEASTTGYLSYSGRWVERVTPDGEAPPVETTDFRTYRHVLAPAGRHSLEKWCVSPARLPPRAYWITHRVCRARPDPEMSSRFEHRHIFGLKTEATDGRNKARLARTPVEAIDPTRHVEEPLLASMLARVFDSDAYRALPPIAPFRTEEVADIVRAHAGTRARSGDAEGALALLDRAIMLAPGSPSYHDYRADLLERSGHAGEAAAARTTAEGLRRATTGYIIHLVREARLGRQLAEARALAEELVREHPEDPLSHYTEAEALSALRDHQGAFAAFGRAIERGLVTCDALARYAVEAAHTRRLAEAAEAYQRMRAVPPTTFEEWLRYFRGRIALGERARDWGAVLATAGEATALLGRHPKMTIAIMDELAGKAQRARESGAPNPEATS